MLSQRLVWIKLNNIRIFSKCTKIYFSPVTIYVGPNGSGKSTEDKANATFKRLLFNELYDARMRGLGR